MDGVVLTNTPLIPHLTLLEGGAWGGRRRLMERRDGERVRRYSRGVQRERTTSRQRREICQQEVLLTRFQSALPCLPQVRVIWGIPSLKKSP